MKIIFSASSKTLPKNIINFLGNLCLETMPEVLDSQPEPDVLVTVLLAQIISELLETRGIGHDLLQRNGPSLDPFFRGDFDDRAVYLPEGLVVADPGV